MTNKLKPCPFCGEKEEIYLGKFYNPTTWWDSGARGEDCYVVCCEKCGANVKEDGEEAVREKWNTRGGRKRKKAEALCPDISQYYEKSALENVHQMLMNQRYIYGEKDEHD